MIDLTDAYENSKYISGAAEYPPRWSAEAKTFRDALGRRARLDLPYGADARQRLDLFLPEDAPIGLVVFVHGGYWLKFDKSYWSHLAAGSLARGFAVAMPSYRLAPDVRIAQITGDVSAAVVAACAEVSGPVVITGHSAGGFLSARMRCGDVNLPDNVAARLRRVVLISPLSDLRPLRQTDMNAELRIDAAEAEAESPVSCSDLRDVECVVWVGAEERPAFLDQARWLSEAWTKCALQIAPGRHHFDVFEELGEADSHLTCALLDGVA